MLLATLVLSLSLPMLSPSITPGAGGHWEGVMQRGRSTLAISIDLDATSPPRGRWSAIDLGALDVPLSNVKLGKAFHFELAGDTTTTVFDGNLNAGAMRGTFRENTSSGTFTLHRTANSTIKPYRVENVTFSNGSVRLAGSLFVPRSAGVHPAVVLVHGSGAEGRWATASIADDLARHGIIALSYDKRGVGASTGDWKTATLQDLAADARAGVHVLFAHRGVDRKRIGVYGHSQGAAIAPLIAQDNNEVRWVGAADGPIGPQYRQDLFRVDNSLASAYTGETLAEAERVYAEFVDTARNGTSHEPLRADLKKNATAPWIADLAIPDDGDWVWTWYRNVGNFDNSQAWSTVRVPVLILFGANDRLVPPQQSLAETTRMLQLGGNRRVWSRVFPDADHTLRVAPATSDGWPHYAPGFLETLRTFAETMRCCSTVI